MKDDRSLSSACQSAADELEGEDWITCDRQSLLGMRKPLESIQCNCGRDERVNFKAGVILRHIGRSGVIQSLTMRLNRANKGKRILASKLKAISGEGA